jgi:hypothetical protein
MKISLRTATGIDRSAAGPEGLSSSAQPQQFLPPHPGRQPVASTPTAAIITVKRRVVNKGF